MIKSCQLVETEQKLKVAFDYNSSTMTVADDFQACLARYQYYPSKTRMEASNELITSNNI